MQFVTYNCLVQQFYMLTAKLFFKLKKVEKPAGVLFVDYRYIENKFFLTTDFSVAYSQQFRTFQQILKLLPDREVTPKFRTYGNLKIS